MVGFPSDRGLSGMVRPESEMLGEAIATRLEANASRIAPFPEEIKTLGNWSSRWCGRHHFQYCAGELNIEYYII